MASHIILLPLSKETDEEVTFELLVEDLGEEVQVRHKGSLQDDGDVRSVEQLDWIWLLITLDSTG